MSDGRFSAKPLRSEQSRTFARGGEYSDKPIVSADTTRGFLQSAAVQREVDALNDQPFHAIGRYDCAPLHRGTPEPARDLGEPLASATLVQEYLIGLLFLRVAGWAFMFFGVMIFLWSAVGFFATIANHGFQEAIGMTIGAAFGVGIACVGAWFGIFRGRVITEMCWFCPHGMIWMTDGVFEWYKWDEVSEVLCAPHAERPAIGISFGANVSWISFSHEQSSRLMVEYLEKLASAACLPIVLQQIAEGRTVRFGEWRLSRTWISNADAEVHWHDVLDVERTRRHIEIRPKQAGKMTVHLDEVPFPSLFTALARACFAQSRA
ncbi:MAG: hypothetical protein HY289_09500 [Planctomycetes bacterium]|nr:hypothetical protein [Planctomycetota bacterium]